MVFITVSLHSVDYLTASVDMMVFITHFSTYALRDITMWVIHNKVNPYTAVHLFIEIRYRIQFHRMCSLSWRQHCNINDRLVATA